MLPYETWKPQNYPPSSAFPYFGAAPGQLPPQFKHSEHLSAMMARNKPVREIMKDRADREHPPYTPYQSTAPSEASEVPALETVEEPPPAEPPLAMVPHRPHDRPDDMPERPAASTMLRTRNQMETGAHMGYTVGRVAGQVMGGTLAVGAFGGAAVIGAGVGMASIASGIYNALPGPRSSSADDGGGNDEVTPPEAPPQVAQRRVERAGPVAERVQAIEGQEQTPEPQPQAQRGPQMYDISEGDPPARPDPPTVRNRPSGSGFLGGLFGTHRPMTFAH